MNIGIYIDSLSDTKQLEAINNFVANSLQHNGVHDVSLFYNGIGFNPFNIKCGMFNSTDLWNFKGKLVVSSLNCLVSSKNIVNNLELYYYYGWEQNIKVLDILQIMQDKIPIICRSVADQEFIYRVTGVNPLAVSNNFDNLLEHIL
jgi:hypothetical protein